MLAEQLLNIGLRATAAQLDDVVALSTKKRWSLNVVGGGRNASGIVSGIVPTAAVWRDHGGSPGTRTLDLRVNRSNGR